MQRLPCIRMGRRGRQREQRAHERARVPRDRMARVQVTDETWAAYRSALVTTPVSVALGKLGALIALHERTAAPQGAWLGREAADGGLCEIGERNAQPSRSVSSRGVRTSTPARPCSMAR